MTASLDRDVREEGMLTRGLVRWVEGVRVRARGVLGATAVVTVACLVYTATHVGINTSHTALLSDDLPFWQEYMAYAEVFPILDESLLVVVDADTAARARDAAEALAGRLREMPDRFSDVFVPGGGEFFERHALLYLSIDELENLSDQVAAAQPVLTALARDRSISQLADLLREGIVREEQGLDGFADLGAIFDTISHAARSVLEGRPEPVSWLDVVSGGGMGGDPESAKRLIVLAPNYDYSDLLPANEPMRVVRAAADELELADTLGARVRITGNVALNTEEMITVARQAVFAAVISFGLVALLLGFALRSRRLVVSILTTLFVGLVWTAAFGTFAVGSLNVVSVSFAVLFIGLGVDFGIHLGMRYAELARDGVAHAAALAETARSVGGSLVLCAATTATGFLVFVPTDYQAVGELGLISGAGMLVSLFCSLTVLPAILSLDDGRFAAREGAETSWPGASRFERSLAALSLSKPRTVVGIAFLSAAAFALVIPSVRFDHNVVAMRDASTESAQTFDDLLADSDTSPWSIDLIAPSLADAMRIAEELGTFEFVERAVTLRDYVPDEQEDKLEILADLAFFVPRFTRDDSPLQDVDEQIASLRGLQEVLSNTSLAEGDSPRAKSARKASDELGRFLAHLETVDRQDVAVGDLQASLTGDLPAQIERLWNALGPGAIELDALPEDLRRRMVSPDGRARVQILPSSNLADNAEHARFVDGVRAVVPSATGSAVSLLEWARAVVRSFQQALVSALVAVVAILFALWRKPVDVGLVLFPLLLAASATTAAAVVFGIPFNFANVVVLPLLLGIGVDSGVHMVHRFRDAALVAPGEGGLRADAGRGLLGSSTAQAVLFSALTTIVSFGSLALSSHTGFASLGQLLVIGVSLTLVCNLVVLPALIASTASHPGSEAMREAPADAAPPN